MSAHETAAKERVSIATQLSEWGEQTGDEAVSDVSDKIGVVLSELGEQEDSYAHALDDSRATLKTIRNTEKSVQPSRDGRDKIADEIGRLKAKEPESTRLVVLEQELVRAEAENLVAEAQLSNVVSFYLPLSLFSTLCIVAPPQPKKKGVTRPQNADPSNDGMAGKIDKNETQGGLQRRVPRHHRARREANHPRPPRPASPAAAGRHPRGPGRRPAPVRARVAGEADP